MQLRVVSSWNLSNLGLSQNFVGLASATRLMVFSIGEFRPFVLGTLMEWRCKAGSSGRWNTVRVADQDGAWLFWAFIALY